MDYAAGGVVGAYEAAGEAASGMEAEAASATEVEAGTFQEYPALSCRATTLAVSHPTQI